MTTEQIKQWVAAGEEWRFYSSGTWKKLRNEVMKDFKSECQDHKEKIKEFKWATMVHHEQELKARPDLALSKYYTDASGVVRRQLTPLCDGCHELRHPERLRQNKKSDELWPERWD